MGDELNEALKQSLEELVTTKDVAAAIEKVKQTYDWVGFAISDVHRFIGEDAARLAASALVKYDSPPRSAVIAQRLRPSEETEEDKKAAIKLVYQFLLKDEIASAVNGFSEKTPLENDPIANLLAYAAGGSKFQEAILQLTNHYAQNPEVVQEALSVRIKEFPELTELLTSDPVSGVIKNHPGIWTRPKLVAETCALAGRGEMDLFGLSGLQHDLSLLNPDYLPESRFKKADVKSGDIAHRLSALSSFLTQLAEPLLGSYKGYEREFANLAYEAYRHGGKDRLRVFAQIIDSSPSQAIGFDVARTALKIWEKARRNKTAENLLGALQLLEFKDALLKAHTGAVSETALKGLVYTANRPDLKITGSVARIFATSTYSNFMELENFFNLVKDEGRYFRQLHQLAQAEAPLAEKTAALRLFAQLKKVGVGAGDPSIDPSWKEAAAKTVRQLLFSGRAKLHESGGHIDAESRADIEAMSIDQLVDFLNIRMRDGLEESWVHLPYDDFPGTESFLARMPHYRAGKGKHWQLDKEYGSLINTNGAGFSPTQLAELLVSGLIGRIPERIESSRQVFGTNLDLARSYVLAGVTSKKAYHAVKRYLNEVRKGTVEAVEPMLKYFSDMIRGEKLEGNPNRKKIEALSDVLEDVRGVLMETTPIKLLTAKLQQVVPSDLFDSRTLHCCTFYPSGVRRMENMSYFGNPNVALLYFLSHQDGRPAKRGVAILLNTALDDGSKALVVDSVEGSPLIRSVNGWQEFALNSIRNVAADVGADKIIVNEHVGGNTPKRFVDWLALQSGAKDSFPLKRIIPAWSGLECARYENGRESVEGYELSTLPTTAVVSQVLQA